MSWRTRTSRSDKRFVLTARQRRTWYWIIAFAVVVGVALIIAATTVLTSIPGALPVVLPVAIALIAFALIMGFAIWRYSKRP